MNTLWRFIRLWKRYPGEVFAGLVLGLLTALAAVGLLSLAGWFISAAAFAGLSMTTMALFNYFLPSSGVRFFALLRIVSRYAERLVTHQVTFKILADLRVWAYQLIEPLAPAHILRYRSGDLLSRMVADIDTLDNLYIRVLSPFLVAFITIGIVMVYFYFFSVDIAWAVLGLMVFALLAVPASMAILGQAPGKTQVQLIADLHTDVVETVQGLGDWLCLGQWSNKLNQIIQHSEAWLVTQATMAQIQGLSAGLLVLLSGSTLWVVLYIALPLVSSGQLNGADLALLSLGVLAAYEALAPIPAAFQYLGKTHAAAVRLQQLAQLTPEVVFPEKSAFLPERYDIAFNQVDFAYRACRMSPLAGDLAAKIRSKCSFITHKLRFFAHFCCNLAALTDSCNKLYIPHQPVLRQFNLSVAQGEIVAIIGASGSGKSTVAHLLVRAMQPNAGVISIGGVALETLAEHDLRQLITLVAQRPHIFNASLRDNLLLANPNATDADLIAILGKVQMEQWLHHLPEGLDTWLGEAGTKLSGGELRRVAVARAILHNAPIWVLDEPNEGLDHVTEKAFWQALAPLMEGKTVLIIAHRLRYLQVNRKVEL